MYIYKPLTQYFQYKKSQKTIQWTMMNESVSFLYVHRSTIHLLGIVIFLDLSYGQ